MSKRRTRKQKKTARHSYSLPDKLLINQPNEIKKSVKVTGNGLGVSLYTYDTKLIVSDLVKTVAVSGIILVIEIVLFWHFKG